MKKALTVALVAVLILSLPAVAMAAKLEGGAGRRQTKQSVQQYTQQNMNQCTQMEGARSKNQYRNTEKNMLGNVVKNMLGDTEQNMHKLMGEAKASQVKSQGAVHIELVIDADGVTTLTAIRGTHVETFEIEIPADLTEEEALAFISETLSTLIEEAFGLEVNSIKLKTFEVDEETGAIVATFIASHGEKLDEFEDEVEDVIEDELDEDEQDEEEDDSTTDL